MKEIFDKLKIAFSKLLTAEEITTLKEHRVKLSAMPPADPAAPAAPEGDPKEEQTSDGQTLVYTGDDFAEGLAVHVRTPDGKMVSAPDGDYVMADDGDTITIANGVVSSIKKADKAAADPGQMAAFAAQLSAQETKLSAAFEAKLSKISEAHKVELAAFKTELSESKKIQLDTLNAVTKIIETPFDSIALSKAAIKEYKDMTAGEKYNHDNPIN